MEVEQEESVGEPAVEEGGGDGGGRGRDSGRGREPRTTNYGHGKPEENEAPVRDGEAEISTGGLWTRQRQQTGVGTEEEAGVIPIGHQQSVWPRHCSLSFSSSSVCSFTSVFPFLVGFLLPPCSLSVFYFLVILTDCETTACGSLPGLVFPAWRGTVARSVGALWALCGCKRATVDSYAAGSKHAPGRLKVTQGSLRLVVQPVVLQR